MKKHTGTLRRRKPSLFVALSGVFLLLNVADAAPPESVFTKSLGFSKKGDNSHPRSPRRKGKLFGGLHEPASKATESARGTSSEDETAPTGLVGFGFGDASSPANAGEARHALYAAALGFSLSVGLLDRDETAIVTPGILDGVEWAAKALRRAVKGGATPEKDMKQLVDKTETVLRDISRVEKMFSSWESLETEIRAIGEILQASASGTPMNEPSSDPLLEVAERLQNFTIADLISVRELPLPSLPLEAKTPAQLVASEAPDLPVRLSAEGEAPLLQTPTVERPTADDGSAEALQLPAMPDGHPRNEDANGKEEGSSETASFLSEQISGLDPPAGAPSAPRSAEPEARGPSTADVAPEFPASRSNETSLLGSLSGETQTVTYENTSLRESSSSEDQEKNSANENKRNGGSGDPGEKILENAGAEESREERRTGDESVGENSRRESGGDENETDETNREMTGVNVTNGKRNSQEGKQKDNARVDKGVNKDSGEENTREQDSGDQLDGKHSTAGADSGATNDRDEMNDGTQNSRLIESEPEKASGGQNSAGEATPQMSGGDDSSHTQKAEESSGQQNHQADLSEKEDDEMTKDSQNDEKINEGTSTDENRESDNASGDYAVEDGGVNDAGSAAGPEARDPADIPEENGVFAEVAAHTSETAGQGETVFPGKSTALSMKKSRLDHTPGTAVALPGSQEAAVRAPKEEEQLDSGLPGTDSNKEAPTEGAESLSQSEGTALLSGSPPSEGERASESEDMRLSSGADGATASSAEMKQEEGTEEELQQQTDEPPGNNGAQVETKSVRSSRSAAADIQTEEHHQNTNGVPKVTGKNPTEESGFLERAVAPQGHSAEAEEGDKPAKGGGETAERQKGRPEAVKERRPPLQEEIELAREHHLLDGSEEKAPLEQESKASPESNFSETGELTAEVEEMDDRERHEQPIIGTAAADKKEVNDAEESLAAFPPLSAGPPEMTSGSLADSFTDVDRSPADDVHVSSTRVGASPVSEPSQQQGEVPGLVILRDQSVARPFLGIQKQSQSQTEQRLAPDVTEGATNSSVGQQHEDMFRSTADTPGYPGESEAADETGGLEDLHTRRRKREVSPRPVTEAEKRAEKGRQSTAKEQQEAFLSREKGPVTGTKMGSPAKPGTAGEERPAKPPLEGAENRKEIVPNLVTPAESEVVQMFKARGFDELLNAKTFDDLRRILGPYMKVTLKDALAFKELSEKLKESGVQEAEIRGMMATNAKPWKTIAASIGLSEKSTETLERCLSQLVAK